MKADGRGMRRFGLLPLPDPSEGRTVVEPPGRGMGFWAGAPSVLHDGENFYLYYRLRSPRERGFECRIAKSRDGLNFTDIWSARKEDFGALSVERACLTLGLDGLWRLYISYESVEEGRWVIDLMEADSPERFDPKERLSALRPLGGWVGHVKDPYVVTLGHLYVMFVSFHPERWGSSNTGLATSGDGRRWTWRGEVFPHGREWDTGVSRVTSVLYVPPVFYVFYDGGEDMRSSTEERVGLAVSLDLKNFQRVSEFEPLFTSPHASGSVRYLDAVQVGDEVWFYYEWAREDGSHELRASVVKLP